MHRPSTSSDNDQRHLLVFDQADYNYDDLRLDNPSRCACGGKFIIDDADVICDSCDMIHADRSDDYVLSLENHTEFKKETLTVEQRRALRRELEYWNKCASNNKIDETVISTVIDIFADLKGIYGEIRNKNRKQLIGACIYEACKIHRNAMTKRATQKLCQLDRNIAQALTNIQISVNNGLLDMSKYSPADSTGVISVKDAFIEGIFNKLLMDDMELRDKVKKDALYALHVLENEIPISSNPDSRSIGTTYIALRLNGVSITLKQLCDLSHIHTETVQSVIDKVKAHKSLFTRFEDRFMHHNEKMSDE